MCDNLARTIRPEAAAVAAIKAVKRGFMSGTVRPMNDMATQVGGAKAGKIFSVKMTKNSKALIFVRSVKLLTASPQFGCLQKLVTLWHNYKHRRLRLIKCWVIFAVGDRVIVYPSDRIFDGVRVADR